MKPEHKIVIIAHLLAIFGATTVNAQKMTIQKYSKSEAEAKIIVDNVLKTSPIIDGHNDLFAWYYGCNYKKLAKCPQDIEDYPLDKIQRGQTDIPRWRKGGVGGVQLNVFADSLSTFLDAYDLLYRLEKTYPNDLEVVGTSAEMRSAMKNGKIAVLPMLEGSVRLEDKPSLLRTFYKLGLRCVTFAYKTNGLADGSDDVPRHNGISTIGREMVKEMNRLGIIIDMSHISAKAMSSILDVSEAPVIFSHSNARAVCDVNRNVPDSILMRLKKNKGLIMIDMAPEHTSNAFVRWGISGDSIYYKTKELYPSDKKQLAETMAKWEKENPKPIVTVSNVADHFDYVKKLIGVDYIGISGDYDGITYTAEGLEDVSCYPNLLIELARRGWSDSELKRITSENFLKVFDAIEQTAYRHRKNENESN